MADTKVEVRLTLKDDLTKAYNSALKGVQSVNKRVLASTKSAVDGIKKGFSGLGSSMNVLKGGIAGVVAALGVNFLKGKLDEMAAFGNRIDKTSSFLKISTKNLQELEFAASQSGVGTQILSNSMRELTKNLGDASAGSISAKTKFDNYGISIIGANGKMLESVDVLKNVADKMSTMGSQSEKVSLAMQIFGGEGSKMVNVLQGGSKAIEDYAKQANNLGLILDESAIQASVQYTDAMDKLNRALDVAKFKVFTPLLKLMVQYISDFLGPIQDGSSGMQNFGDSLRVVGETIVVFIKIIRTAYNVIQIIADFIVTVVIHVFLELKTIIEAVADGFSSLGKAFMKIVTGDFKGAISELKTGFSNLGDNFKANVDLMGENIKTFVSDTKVNVSDLNFTWASHAEVITSTAETANVANEIMTEGQKKAVEAQKALFQELGLLRLDDKEREFEELTIWYNEKYEIAKGNNDLLIELEETFNSQKQEITDKYFGQEQKLREENSKKQMDQFNRDRELRLQGLQEYTSASVSLATNLLSVYENLGKKSKATAIAGRAIAISQATIDTYVGANKAIAQGGIFGIPMAALIVAGGLANVAAIASQKFQRGGIVQGSGGVDSQNIRATPGEMILTSSDQSSLLKTIRNGGGGGGVSFNDTIIINGGDPQAIKNSLLETRTEQLFKAEQYQKKMVAYR